MNAYEVTILRQFSNYKSLKRIIVIADKMPNRSEIQTKENDEIMEIKEMREHEVMICHT